MKVLPVGVQSFAKLRQNDMLYVDKTARLLELATQARSFFLARPRRFGKSLTLSTLNAMFSGRSELFKGLAAESWVRQQSANPRAVLHLDMSVLARSKTATELNDALGIAIDGWAVSNNVPTPSDKSAKVKLQKVLQSIYKKSGAVIILIDEYDKPILDNIANIKKATEMRDELHDFYTAFKGFDDYIHFLFITGISKFSKTGMFSSMNNLKDITFDDRFNDIVGYTQTELEAYFSEWIKTTALKIGIDCSELLYKLKYYYDGFSFNGIVKIYNPFSILNFFDEGKFKNYWHASGSPSFLIKWLKKHKVQTIEQYRHINVASNFLDSHEIEHADVAGFLFQSGYLTIEKVDENFFILDIPNQEVLSSLSLLFFENIYKITDTQIFIKKLLLAYEKLDIKTIVDSYNTVLARIPFEAYKKNKNESWYSSIFMTMIQCTGCMYYAEVHTYTGKSDIVIQYKNNLIVVEFKYSKKLSSLEKKKLEGFSQFQKRRYEKSYYNCGFNVKSAVVVAVDEKRKAEFFIFDPNAYSNS